ncbi:unknown [Bacteroides intestinalis CAG:315]|nr:unknown [Bacteroides intestinalis CAG:315]
MRLRTPITPCKLGFCNISFKASCCHSTGRAIEASEEVTGAAVGSVTTTDSEVTVGAASGAATDSTGSGAAIGSTFDSNGVSSAADSKGT